LIGGFLYVGKGAPKILAEYELPYGYPGATPPNNELLPSKSDPNAPPPNPNPVPYSPGYPRYPGPIGAIVLGI
jgi:hypothetical protein